MILVPGTLKEMQCDMFQGYHFGRPVDKGDFERMFLENKE